MHYLELYAPSEVMSSREERAGKVDRLEWAPYSREYGFYSPLMSGSIDGTDTRPHDRGVVRAMGVEYKPNKHVTGDPESTVFVARLDPDTTEDRLKEVFSKYGKIENCRLVRDIVTGRSKCYGFVEYQDHRDTADAYNRANKMWLDGSQILVEFECSRSLPGWIPRRFGGGFGGKKESGQLRFGGRERPFRQPIVLGSKGLRGSRRDYGGGERATNLRDRRSSHSMEDEERRYRHRSHQRDRERESGRDRERRSNWRERESESRRERHSSSRRHNRRSNSRSRSRSKSPHNV